MKNKQTNQTYSFGTGRHLSPHFTLFEMTRSGSAIRLGIENKPSDIETERLERLCRTVLEPLRCRFGAIRVTSGFRCELLNSAVGGVPRSQHILGEAADLNVSSLEQGEKMFRFIRDNLVFDQLILEHKHRPNRLWLHVSYTIRRANRREAFRVNM